MRKDVSQTGQESVARNHRDLAACGVLVLIVCGFLLPLLGRWLPAIWDDCPIETLPGLIATARTIQSGAIPLWDSAIFAGAKPPYADGMYMPFYLPMYPFFMLVDTTDASQCHLLLMLVPFALHLIFAAVGGYVFGRQVVGMHPLGALLLGVLYSLSPEMGFKVVAPQDAMLLSYLPWCLWALSKYMATGSIRWWLTAILLLGLMSSAGGPNYLIRAYFVMATTVTMLWVFLIDSQWTSARRGERADGPQPGRWWFLPRYLGGVSIFVLSVALTGFAWAGTFESARWIEEAIPLTTQTAAHFAPISSMHPLNVVTLFLPGFFGGLDARHSWGVGITLSNHATLCGGMALMVAVVGAVVTWIRRRGETTQQRTYHRWTWISVVLSVGALLTMMGGYTPVFRAFCAVLPWFFRFPHPVYYRFAVCWSIAVLVGIGVSTLLSESLDERRRKKWVGAFIGCAILALGVATLAFFWTTTIEEVVGTQRLPRDVSSYETLTLFREWSWFVSRPIAYFAAVCILFTLLFSTRLVNRLGYWIWLGVLVESLYVAALIFYGTAYLGLQYRSPPLFLDTVTSTQTRRELMIEDDALYQLAQLLDELWEEHPVRVVGTTAVFDNAVWYMRGRSLLGYPGKPLIPWYAEMVQQIYTGKNELTMVRLPAHLTSNMNVGFVIALPHQQLEGGAPYRQTESVKIYRLAEPMPYIYTQDRLVARPFSSQLESLMTTDLRRAGYIDPADAAALGPHAARAAIQDEPAGAQPFSSLQQQNVILDVDQSRGNRTVIEVEMARPALLVRAECWHPGWKATVDGTPQRVLRVNFLQQGVWLEEGRHRVELNFLPRSVQYGTWVSLLAALVVALVFAVSVYRGRLL